MSFWTRRRRPRVSGYPTSATGASSFHLWWDVPPGVRIVEVRSTVEVRIPPVVDRLYFWALQVSFADRGRQLGGAHTGLQWHPSAPGREAGGGGAVNWGGYRTGGGELPGTESDLPAVDSVNTRRWLWKAGIPYQLRVWSPTDGAWRAEVTDTVSGTTTIIRDLLVPAREMTSPVVWAEVFARCDDPPTEARWTDLSFVGAGGDHHAVRSVRLSYQPEPAGGCSNTESSVDGGAFVQRTGLAAPRAVDTAAELSLRSP